MPGGPLTRIRRNAWASRARRLPTMTGSPTTPSLRARLLLGAGCLALLAVACIRDESAADPARLAELEPAWSIQLHVHGSFSEGMGSIDSHSFEAAALGVDAIWWSDHDFRITSYEHVRRFRFEDWNARIDSGEPWVSRLARHRQGQKTIEPTQRIPGSTAEFVAEPVFEGEKSFRVVTTHAGPDFQAYPFELTADRMIHRRPLSGGIQLRVAVLAEEGGPDARAFVRLQTSEHAPRGESGLTTYSVRYVLANDATEPWREGTTFHVPLAYRPGEWNELVLPLTEDLARGFPSLPAGDSALYRILVGVESRAGATAAAAFDDLRIEHGEEGPAMFARQREVIEEVAALYPEVRQFQGVEVSYASRHMNEFSLEPELLDYEALKGRVAPDADDPTLLDENAFRREVARAAVAGARARGGLVSYNHLFGVALEGAKTRRTREEQLDVMLRSEAFGADLLEVGYRDRGGADLADHLWVWDEMALAGLRLVGTGVSDSHGGPDERWSGRPNNFVSWIYSGELEQAALLAGLRAGRVFFGDIERFDGRFDLVTDDGRRMGETVRTSRDRVPVFVLLEGAEAGDQLVFVERGEEATRVRLDGTDAVREHVVTIPAEGPTFLRAELYDAQGEAKAFTNPIHFVR